MTNQTKAYLAYAFICIIWGTTFLAIKIAVDYYPPFLMAGVRQVVSGLILGMIALMINKKVDLSMQNLKRQALIGFLLITMGNGLVTWAEKYMPSGVAALICSTMPISTVLINVFNGKESFNLRVLIGLLMGFGGVALIFQNSLGQQSTHHILYYWSVLALFVATFCWALGSIYNKRNANAINSLFNSGFQILFGGTCMLLISPVVDDYSNFKLWQPEGFMAFAYLVVFGSILAYAAYMFALKILPVGFVTSYAYVNPIVAVLLGSFWLGESLTLYTVIALLLIILAIFVVRSGYKKQTANLDSEPMIE